MKRDPTAPDPDELRDFERMHRHLLGDLSPDEFHLLEKDLLSSRESRDRFLQAVRADVVLHDGSVFGRNELPRKDSTFRPGRRMTAGIAALVALAAVVSWQVFRRDPDKPGPPVGAMTPVPTPAIATLLDARDCRWKTPAVLATAPRLPARSLELESGVAVIEFDGGARLALQAPATLELIGPKAARLHRGTASVRCEQGLYGFSLLTPTSTVIDLGTEFGVDVGPDGAAEIHVLEGEVEVADTISKENRSTMFLGTGETVLLKADGESQRLESTTREWTRDYSSPADREARLLPPRVIARDVFPVDPDQDKRFSLGTGWKGAWWQATTGTKGDFRFVPLEPLVKRNGNPGMAMLVGGWVEVRRTLEEPIDPTVPGTVYVGFSLHRMNSVQRDKSGKLSEATVMFRSSKDPATRLGVALSGRNHWVVLDPGGWERSELPVNAQGPFFVIAKVEFDPRLGNRVSMAGFENIAAVPMQEPGHWDLVTRRRLAPTEFPLDVIAIQVRLTPFKFGELTLGDSWQSVADPSVTGK